MPNTNSRYSDEHWGNIDTDIYDWSIKVFRALRKMLSVNVQMDAASQIAQGDIFLFNHFSRFETFIPQYMLHEQTGAYCCSIASSEFFVGDTLLANYLKNVGAVPHDHPRLFAILAGQILRGRKVIIFPEGGMVKDRRVLDKRGHYSIYSRITGERRKQHTGPAVLAQGLETFKACVRNAYKNKNIDQLMRWKDEFEVDNLEQLLMQALKPTLIIPANITFYPIRSSENILHKGVEMLSKGLSLRQTEELLIEGNIIFKDTDMNIRMGKPIAPYHVWHWWNRTLLERCSSGFCSLDDVFDFHAETKSWTQKILKYYFKKNAAIARNLYMKEMYANVTINLCHLASTLIMHCIEGDQEKIEKHQFYTTLYIAIKLLQNNETIYLHPSLSNPDDYRKLLQRHNERFEQFIHAAEQSGLIVVDKNHYFFTPKLREEYDFDAIRMENPIAVYNNEVKPIVTVLEAIVAAIDMVNNPDKEVFAAWYFEDENLALAHDRKLYLDPKYDEINKRETAHLDPQPFFLVPQTSNGHGVLLIHGLLASPAELRAYGEYLAQQGYTVLGVRIKGHGTSPCDLRDRTWQEWYASTKMGLEILQGYCTKPFVIGFSTGGALALLLAAEFGQTIAGYVAVSVPVKFAQSSFMLVPMLHSSHKVVKWMASLESLKPYIDNIPEHPAINYRSIPIKSLYELRQLIEETETALPTITAPGLIIYADADPIVSSDSAEWLYSKLDTVNSRLIIVKAERHGILMENLGGSWGVINEFLLQQRQLAAAVGTETEAGKALSQVSPVLERAY